jgi:acetylornithine/succinyldiaminopimelate/putrescine aminotransferase
VGCRALEICSDPATLANVESVAARMGKGLEDIRSRHPFLLEIRQKGVVMGLKFDARDGGMQMTAALFQHGVWAMFAGFDRSVLQWKPGMLVDNQYCDEALQRFEDALSSLTRSKGNANGR